MWTDVELQMHCEGKAQVEMSKEQQEKVEIWRKWGKHKWVSEDRVEEEKEETDGKV